MSGIMGGAGSKSGVIGQTEIEYEEGEWTPSSSINLIPSSGANYTRIGNRVTVSAYLTTTQSTTSGDFVVGGLPFTNTGASQAAGSIYLRALAGNIDGDGHFVIVIAAGTSFYVRRGGNTDSGNNVHNYMDNGSNFWMSLTYEIGA